MALSEREVSAGKCVRRSVFHTCAVFGAVLGSTPARSRAKLLASDFLQTTWETRMTWKTPKIVEVPVGMEINMYACAARK